MEESPKDLVTKLLNDCDKGRNSATIGPFINDVVEALTALTVNTRLDMSQTIFSLSQCMTAPTDFEEFSEIVRSLVKEPYLTASQKSNLFAALIQVGDMSHVMDLGFGREHLRNQVIRMFPDNLVSALDGNIVCYSIV